MNKRLPLILFASFLILAASLLPSRTALADFEEEFPPKDNWTKVTPSVVWCDDPDDTVTIEVHIVNRHDVARVWVTDMGTDEDERRSELFDDGTHGDLTAGDNIFTLADVVLPCNIVREYGRWNGMLRVELNDGTYAGNNYGLSAGLIDSSLKGVFAVTELGPGLSATPYAFFINDSDHAVMNDYPVADVYCGRGNNEAFKILYSVLPDVFDFALIMPGMQIFRPSDLAENVPYDVLVSNSVQNIGLPQMDKSAEFGSDGMLKSVIYHSFGSIDIVDHEVAHTWGAALGKTLNLLTHNNVTQSHWNAYSDIAGQLSSYYFADSGSVGHFSYNGDETWRLIPNYEAEPYSPLELYMMGLIPADEVLPIHILTNPDLTDPERITAESYKTITIEEIIAAEGGERIPSAQDSQKDFNLAFIVSQDYAFNNAAYAYFSLMSYDLMAKEPIPYQTSFAPFYWATEGLATLNTLLPVGLPDPFAPPTPTPIPPTPDPGTATAEALLTQAAIAQTEAAAEVETEVAAAETELANTEEAPVAPTPTQLPAEEEPQPVDEPPPNGICNIAPVGLILLPGALSWWRKKRKSA